MLSRLAPVSENSLGGAQMQFRSLTTLALITVFVVVMAACGKSSSQAEVQDAGSTNSPTSSIASTNTPVPTANAVPTVVQTPTPTNTPQPTPTSEPTATPVPVQYTLPELGPVLGKEDDGIRGALAINYTDWLPNSKGSDLKPATLDIFTPAEDGDWPIVVIMPGSDSQPRRYLPLAQALAKQGYMAVVFHYVTMNIQTPYQVPRSVEEASCAVRFARKAASDYGSQNSSVVFVGHSFGGYIGSIISNTADDWTGSCLVNDESGLPNHFIGVAGFYSIAVGRSITASVFQLDGPMYVNTFLGGTVDEVPEAYFAMDAINHIGRNKDLTITLITGKSDETRGLVSAKLFAEELAESGVIVEPIVTDNGHLDVVSPNTEGGQAIIERVLELVPIE
jgi:acetyl esterase/lipase